MKQGNMGKCGSQSSKAESISDDKEYAEIERPSCIILLLIKTECFFIQDLLHIILSSIAHEHIRRKYWKVLRMVRICPVNYWYDNIKHNAEAEQDVDDGEAWGG